MTLAALIISTAFASSPLVAVVPLDALRPAAQAEDDAPPVQATIQQRTIQVSPGSETGVRLTLELSALKAGWVDLPIVGDTLAVSRATLDGHPARLARGDDGWLHLAHALTGKHTLEIVGSVQSPGDQLRLNVAPAARSAVHLTRPGLTATVDHGQLTANSDGRQFVLEPVSAVAIQWRPATPPAERPRVILGEAATALAADGSGLRAHARLRYQVIYGESTQLSFTLDGPATDLVVEGPSVSGFTRSGAHVTVNFSRPLTGDVALTVRYETPTPPDGVPQRAPVPVPQGDRVSGWVTLLQGEDGVIVPAPGGGLAPTWQSALPPWARGLAPGNPIGTWRQTGRKADLDWTLLNYEPVDQPATLVDEARYEIVHVSHGRVLIRAQFQVRNERNQYLALTLPPGTVPFGVKVAGQPVHPVHDADGRLRIPLEKSVETLDGLVAFPVELLAHGSQEAWSRKGDRTLQSIAVNAPVAYAQWTVTLPPGLEAKVQGGSAEAVASWTPRSNAMQYGRAYGRGLDQDGDDDYRADAVADMAIKDTRKQTNARGGRGWGRGNAPAAPDVERAAQSVDVAASQDAWNDAYTAYKDNRFEEAGALLSQSLALNPDNASAASLMGNVDVLLDGIDDSSVSRESRRGTSDGKSRPEADKADQAQVRRIRELAKAKTSGKLAEQSVLQQEAERKERMGDTSGAAEAYRQLVEVTRDLAVVEQVENNEQKGQLSNWTARVEDLEKSLEQPASPAKNRRQAALSTDSISRSSVSTRAPQSGVRANQVEGLPMGATFTVMEEGEDLPVQRGFATIVMSDELPVAVAEEPNRTDGFGGLADAKKKEKKKGEKAEAPQRSMRGRDRRSDEAVELIDVPDRFVQLLVPEGTVTAAPTDQPSTTTTGWTGDFAMNATPLPASAPPPPPSQDGAFGGEGEPTPPPSVMPRAAPQGGASDKQNIQHEFTNTPTAVFAPPPEPDPAPEPEAAAADAMPTRPPAPMPSPSPTVAPPADPTTVEMSSITIHGPGGGDEYAYGMDYYEDDEIPEYPEALEGFDDVGRRPVAALQLTGPSLRTIASERNQRKADRHARAVARPPTDHVGQPPPTTQPGTPPPLNRPGAAPPPPERPVLPALTMSPEVTASKLSLSLPEAGQTLRFEQRLLPENAPLTANLRYRTPSNRSRK